MVKGKARAAGSFLGGITNNPGIVIIALVLGGLFLFRDKISEAFQGFGEGLGNIDITLPEIKLPDITFPEFNFPEFPDFSNVFEGFQNQLNQLFQNQASILAGQTVPGAEGQDVQIPPDTVVNPDGTVSSTTPPTTQTTGDDLSTLFGELRPQVFDTLINIGLSFARATDILSGAKTFEDLQVILEQANTGIFTQLQGTLDIIEERGDPLPNFFVQSFLEEPQQFGGGGVSFIGGSIFSTPIENLTLNQIINMFGVTASQAANLKALGGFTPQEESFLGGFLGFNPPSVSDPQFEGLTPTQIALFLTGGNIQNF